MTIQEIINRPQRGFKRPLPRPPRPQCTPPFVRPTEGVVHDILNLPQFVHLQPKATVAQDCSDEYIRLLKKNYEYWNVPFREPKVIDLLPKHKVSPEPERHIAYLDQVQVRLSVLKNGKIRVKCVTHGAQLYEKYYSLGKQPPLKVLSSAYKNLGYSEAFLQNMSDKHKARVAFGKKLGKILDAIFDKSSAKTKKKKKEELKREEEQEEERDEEEEEEEDGPEEDEALVADDEDEDVEEVIEEDLDLE